MRENREKPQQVPPLRYAPVGMTLHPGNETWRSQTKVSSRPKRSVVEGPAVAFPGSHAYSLARTLRC
jgi:hypothetical protein